MNTKEPIVFGKTFICKRCGHVAQSKSLLRVSASVTSGDAYLGEFCEYCVPGSMLAAFLELTLDTIRQEPQP